MDDVKEAATIIDLQEDERGHLIHTDPQGRKHTHYRARPIYLVVEDLQSLYVLTEPPHGQHEPVIVRRLRGTARLEDRSLAVIGSPQSRTATLQICFEDSESQPPCAAAVAKTPGSTINNLAGIAMLSFNRQDWEIGIDDLWWTTCHLPRAFNDQIEARIHSREITSIRVGLMLEGLYCDETDWAPISARRNLFIRPNREDNDLSSPADMANGFVTGVFLTGKKTALQSEPDEPEDRPEAAVGLEQSDDQVPAQAVSEAIMTLASRLAETRTTIKWAAGFIVAALLVVAGAR